MKYFRNLRNVIALKLLEILNLPSHGIIKIEPRRDEKFETTEKLKKVESILQKCEPDIPSFCNSESYSYFIMLRQRNIPSF